MNVTLLRVRSTMGAVLVALGILAVAPISAAGATHPIGFDLSIGSSCIDGTASDGSTVHLVWRDADGTRKARATIEATPSGYWSYCSRDGDVVEIGDRLRAKDGVTERLFVVPELKIVINRVDDILKGRGPANQYVRVICGYVNGFEPCTSSWRVRVNSEGKWSLRRPWDLVGWQAMYLRWKSGGDSVWTGARGPYLDVTIGSAFVRGSARAYSPVTVVLRRAGSDDVKAVGVGTASPYMGGFRVKLRDMNGNAVKVRAGDRVTSDVSPDEDWIVPNVTATADADTDLLTGTCPPFTFLVTGEVMRNGYLDGTHTWPDDDVSNFQLDMDWLDIQPGESVRVSCFVEDPGDWFGRWIIAQ